MQPDAPSHLDAGEHLVGGVASVVDDHVVPAKGGRVGQDGVQQGLVGLVACGTAPAVSRACRTGATQSQQLQGGHLTDVERALGLRLDVDLVLVGARCVVLKEGDLGVWEVPLPELRVGGTRQARLPRRRRQPWWTAAAAAPPGCVPPRSPCCSLRRAAGPLSARCGARTARSEAGARTQPNLQQAQALLPHWRQVLGVEVVVRVVPAAVALR